MFWTVGHSKFQVGLFNGGLWYSQVQELIPPEAWSTKTCTAGDFETNLQVTCRPII